MTTASAPGKIILFGEHAVVYGRPAIAAPVSQVRATAVAQPNPDSGVRIIAPDLSADFLLADAAEDDALAVTLRQIETAAKLSQLPDLIITVSSQIPIASGLGSGAAIAAAVIRAVAGQLGLAHLATDEWVSNLTYEVEKIHHGTPSGIDNTVVAYEKPVYFVRRQPTNLIETFAVKRPLRLLVADTGIRSSTKIAVGDVRRHWLANPDQFEVLFDGCGRIAATARTAIEMGDIAHIGRLMTANQRLLEEMTVSSPELERLVMAALQTGALGAKLSGAGRGGNMITLVEDEGMETAVRAALLAAGAKTVLTTTIKT
ncbi:MAG: mevalonate kinase [Ardenticatenaceae bacterium]|nr:mevalonate kinase [Ardenticatenaceae bacterium]MCB9444577.1 mevalonate kinase [Ardenticatenaceae bacterium]